MPATEQELRALDREWREADRNRTGGLTELDERVLAATHGLEEHPEWWDLPCCCDLCLSYGDIEWLGGQPCD